MSCIGFFKCFDKDPKRVLILGLDGSGKTTLIYLLKYKELITTLPTVGFNIEELQIARKLTVRLWDVGGHHKVRHLWTHYYMTTAGIIYMIDASSRERLKESKDEFYKVLKHPDVKENIPVILFANKTDIEGSLSVNEITDYFELKEFVKNPWCVQNCSTQTQEGVWKGIEIFSDMVKQNKHKT